MPFPARCARCRELFEADTMEYARSPGRICGRCYDDLRDEADADRGAAEHEASGPHEATTDLF